MNIKWLFLLILLVSSLTFAAPLPSEKWVVDLNKGTGSIEFNAIGRPSALRIHGKGDKATGLFKVNGLTLLGTATFMLDSLDTGIKLRNKHMKKKYLETDQYPQAKFTFTKALLPETLKSGNGAVKKTPFEGILFIHGVEKSISGIANIERKENEISVLAAFGLKVSDFNIAIPSFAGITMAENVDVQVQLSSPFTKIP
jgi:polyisoprenoid-binding protein YceI